MIQLYAYIHPFLFRFFGMHFTCSRDILGSQGTWVPRDKAPGLVCEGVAVFTLGCMVTGAAC